MNTFKKILRYIFLYGIRRTLAKVLYKLNNRVALFVLLIMYNFGAKHRERIGIIGLGNHGFTLIAFFVCVVAKRRFSFVIDPSEKSKVLANKVLKCKHYRTVEEAIIEGAFHGDLVYIASDHLSHTRQALLAANSFKKIYVEKPLFVNTAQQVEFQQIYKQECEVFTGFNRPHSPYFAEMQQQISGAFSLSMVINGHYLPQDHWYRNAEQGSRVLGNLTHWLDMSMRVFDKHGGLGSVKVELAKGNLDDISLSLSIEERTINLLFSANCEPVDGVEEFVFWNSDSSMGRIINFKEINYVRKNRERRVVKKWSKNVGHGLAVMSPLNEATSDSRIAFLSSALALRIEEMYINEISHTTVKLNY